MSEDRIISEESRDAETPETSASGAIRRVQSSHDADAYGDSEIVVAISVGGSGHQPERVGRANGARAELDRTHSRIGGGIVRQLLELANEQLAAQSGEIEQTQASLERLSRGRDITNALIEKLNLLLTALTPAE